MNILLFLWIIYIFLPDANAVDQCFDAQRALPANKPLPDKLITGYCTCYEKYKKTDMPAMRCYNIMWDDFHKLSKGIK